MPVPFIQLLVGLGIGIIGYFVLRPRPIQMAYDEGHSRRAIPNSKPEDDCCICLRQLDEEPMTYLRCRHALHTQCLRQLKNSSKLCPLCRAYL